MVDKQNGRAPQDIERLSIFELGGKLFGLDIFKAREVIPVPRFTPLPNSEEIFLGVFNLRGEIYPLVDVSPVLGLARKNVGSDDMVIIVEDAAGFPFGMLIDKIHSVIACSSGDMKNARGMVPKSMEKFLKGVLPHRDIFIYKLDLENIYRAKQILAHF
ncbi:MAG: chemotaxis protein CheW [Calditrichia bacterium]|nr:purine-binding chemotaxis protein CheW [Calditrichota bacterium]MCB9066552.1 purine-binding chemotaxis protein CheW [Calditrichia bacterium]